MRLLTALGLTAALLGAGACTDQYGRPDPVGTAVLGAAVGVAAGLAVSGAMNQPRNTYSYPRGGGGYNRGYGGGYGGGGYGGGGYGGRGYGGGWR